MLSRAYKAVCSIPQDKILHFLTGQIFAFLFARGGPVVMIVASLVLGVSKEAYDLIHPDHEAELMDIVATALGGTFAAFAAWMVGCA